MLHASLGVKKNDLCRIWARTPLLGALGEVLGHLCALPADEGRDKALLRAGEILLVFARADLSVKSALTSEGVLRPLLALLGRLQQGSAERALLLLLVKALYSVSTDSRTLDGLQACGAVSRLVPLLEQAPDPALTQYLLMALFNLCRLVQARQVEAARGGLIPPLQAVIASNSTSKQFALPLLLEFARARPVLPELWKHEGVAFYVGLFEQGYPWQVQAVDALASWLAAEPERVSSALLATHGVPALVRLFATAQGEASLNMLEPTLRWLQHAPQLALALVEAGFLDPLLDKLQQQTPNALARVNLLKILKAVHEPWATAQRPFPAARFTRILQELAADRAVLVAEMASQLQRLLK